MAATHLSASAMEQLALPDVDVLADGNHQLDLPMIPDCESAIRLANGNDLNRQQTLPGECEEFEVPQAHQEFSFRKRRKVHEQKVKFGDLPYLRTSALLDLPTIAIMFGADLLSVPTSWLDEANARQLIAACGIVSTVVMQWFLLEIFAGCGHLSQASREAGLATGPSIDKLPADGRNFVTDLLTPEGRRIVWAMLVIFRPMWIHLGFPCTFWSRMAHMTRNQDIHSNEQTRLQELVFIAFSRQVVKWQASRRQHVSIENPPQCRSWALDITQDMVDAGELISVNFDGCAWGMVDPGNGLAYKKAMRIASTVDLSVLQRRCKRQHEHQIVEDRVASGARKGARRSQVSGEYPMDLCHAWVACMRAAVGA